MQKQARIVAICHPKGGVGKTTTTMILSAALAERGYGVLVADCDAQASASAWANAAPEGKPFPAAVVNLSAYAGKVHREIQRQLDNYDFIVICVFRAKLDTHSTANWTSGPAQTGHRFRSKLDSLKRPE